MNNLDLQLTNFSALNTVSEYGLRVNCKRNKSKSNAKKVTSANASHLVSPNQQILSRDLVRMTQRKSRG